MHSLRLLGPYVVFLAIVLALVVAIRHEEARLPNRARVPWPTVRVEGLTFLPSVSTPAVTGEGRLGFTAEHAKPRSSGRVITLGGFREGLDLRGVAVELAPGVLLRGSTGSYVAENLSLSGEVFVECDGRRCLDARQVEVRGPRLRFPGLVVIYSTGRRSTAVDLDVSLAELIARLR